MDLMFRAWEDIPFNENHVKQLHQILLQYSQKDEWHRGNYKTRLQQRGCLRRERRADRHRVRDRYAVRYAAPDGRTATWVNNERDKLDQDRVALHPLLIIAIFVVVFLEIHPFQDGNGRKEPC